MLLSIKNKASDRDPKGRIRRKYTTRSTHFVHWSNAPSAWVNAYMNRPKRRSNKRLCERILRGADPDGVVFPVGNRKPHVYYW